MSSRLNYLITNNDPYRQVVDTIKKISANLDESKSRQRTSGRNGLLAYSTQNGTGYDIVETVGTAGDPNVKILDITVTFTGDGTQKAPFLNPFLDIFIGGTTEANRLSPTQPMIQVGANSAQLSWLLRPDKSLYGSDYARAWTTRVFYIGQITYRLKSYAKGTSTGSIAVARALS